MKYLRAYGHEVCNLLWRSSELTVDGWTDGRMGGWMDGRMGRWTDRLMEIDVDRN